MDTVAEELKIILGTTFAFYLKAHQFHWNVTGPDFAQYHDYLGDLYSEVHASIDTTAEEIRKLGHYAPGSLSRFMELSQIADDTVIDIPKHMIKILAANNETIINLLYRAREAADQNKAYGTVNYLEDRISAHEKHQWMLKAFMM